MASILNAAANAARFEVLISGLSGATEATARRIMQQVAAQRLAGVSEATIRGADFSAAVAPLIAEVRTATAQVGSIFYQRGMVARYEEDLDGPVDEQAFMWLAVGLNSCTGCIARHGQIKTYAEWESIGTPGIAPTPCGYNCRCALVPEKTAGFIYGKPGSTPDELTRAAQEPIRERAAELKRLNAEREESGLSPLKQSTLLTKLGRFRNPELATVSAVVQ